jgi:protein TonB
MLSFQYRDSQGAPKQKGLVKYFTLVNLALVEPPRPRETPPRPEPAQPEPPPPKPPEPATEPAETLIALEAPFESADAPEPASVEDPQPSDPPEEPDSAALARTYLRNNYEYIQRHIRNKLVYPLEARNAGIQGVAELSFVIHTDGHISNVTITTSSGSETLDASAVEAIYSAAPFRPPPRQARLVIPVAFRLR